MHIQKYFFDTGKEGPSFLVLGAIHGNEICGPAAIERIQNHLEKGTLKLAAGNVTFIPVCNPRAFSEKKRFIDKDLNRYFYKHTTPDFYEAELANILCAEIAQGGYTHLLDIHSFRAPGVPFIFQDHEDAATTAFTRVQEVDYILTGWPDVYAGNPEHGDTVAFAHAQGLLATLIECGQHDEPLALERAEKSIINSLRFLGMLPEEAGSVTSSTLPAQTVRFKTLYHKQAEGELFYTRNLEPVKKDTCLARTVTGQEIIAPEDGFILMPKTDALVGEEWFYFGIPQADHPALCK